jgi:hypothetical protein
MTVEIDRHSRFRRFARVALASLGSAVPVPLLAGDAAAQPTTNQPPQILSVTATPNPFFGPGNLQLTVQVADPNGLANILGVHLLVMAPFGQAFEPIQLPQVGPGIFGLSLTNVSLPHGAWQLLAGVVDQGGLFDLSDWIPFLVAVPPSTPIAFDLVYVDDDYGIGVGWVRAGDVDLDGDLDLVAGGGYRLYAYEAEFATRPWAAHGNLDPTNQMGANGGELYDVDGDGDLDVVSAWYYDRLGWWENPGGPLDLQPWTFHTIYQQPASSSFYLHDVIRADLDEDGEAEEFVFNLISGANLKIEWFRPTSNPTAPWERHVVEPLRNHGNNDHAGLDAGDVDGDGDVDLAYSNGWYESTGNPTGAWIWHPVTSVGNVSNALLRDMDGDSDLDLVTSSGHGGTAVAWHENDGTPAVGPWTFHPVGSSTNPEGLVVEDLDYDGDLDVVACELFWGSWSQQVHNVYLFRNTGTSTSWSQTNLAPNSWPSHLLLCVDLNEDGKLDLISEGAGFGVVSYFQNTTP